MRLIIIILACLSVFFINTLSFCLDNKEKEISLESSNLEYDLGTIDKGKSIQKTIRIRNKLNQPLEISDVRSTCECIKVNLKPQTVSRGAVFFLDISLDALEMEGNIEEVVYILTQNMDYQVIRLVISAHLK